MAFQKLPEPTRETGRGWGEENVGFSTQRDVESRWMSLKVLETWEPGGAKLLRNRVSAICILLFYWGRPWDLVCVRQQQPQPPLLLNV